jgi:hypothetical protein
VSASESLRRFSGRAFGVGAAAMALGVAGAFFDRAQFFRAYLIGWTLWLGIALGSLALLMLYHLVGGRWGFLLRRFFEAGSRTLPFVGLAFVPLLFGLKDIYPWTHPDIVARNPRLLLKSTYLSVPFFIGRAAFVFGVWILFMALLNRWSARQDETDDPEIGLKMQRLSAPGLLVYGLTTLFASVDWLMSITPLWWSTIYGMTFMVGQGLSTMAFMILAVRATSGEEPVASQAEPGVLRDFGNLLFMFIILRAYMAFSQLIIIWSGNLTDEITWYMPRLKTNWNAVSLGLLLLYFGLPFLMLLSRRLKYSIHSLSLIAGLVFVMRLVDLIWFVEPAYHPDGISAQWLDLVVPLGLGGLWVGLFSRQLASRPLLALHDARLEGAEGGAHA